MTFLILIEVLYLSTKVYYKNCYIFHYLRLKLIKHILRSLHSIKELRASSKVRFVVLFLLEIISNIESSLSSAEQFKNMNNLNENFH